MLEFVNWVTARRSNKSALVRAILHRIYMEWLARPDEFDRKYGVETRHTVWRKRLAGEDSEDYQAVSPWLFSRVIPYVPRATFIDLGCGKGRALILAHAAGFRDLIGVEISPRLARDARRNLLKLQVAASILQADVATYLLPDEPVVVFMYNPFGVSTMQAVLEKLRRHRHRLHLIYINPKHSDLFSGFRQVYCDQSVAVISNDQIQLEDERQRLASECMPELAQAPGGQASGYPQPMPARLPDIA
jgi:SAM-dependent methyltransferase